MAGDATGGLPRECDGFVDRFLVIGGAVLTVPTLVMLLWVFLRCIDDQPELLGGPTRTRGRERRRHRRCQRISDTEVDVSTANAGDSRHVDGDDDVAETLRGGVRQPPGRRHRRNR